MKSIMSDKPSRVIFCLIGATFLFTGCSTFKKKSPEEKSITTQVEQSFKQRWIERRSSELVGQGQSGEAARNQAVSEFRQRYEFTGAAQE
jgi:hypothetical protein